MIHHAQGRQRLVAFDAAVFLRHPFTGVIKHRAVVPVGADVLEANAWRDGPVANVNLVVDVDRIGLGSTGTVLIDMAVRPRTHDRLIVDQCHTAGLFVHGLFQVAITDADFLGGRAHIEDVRHPWFDTVGVVGARVGVECLQVTGGDVAATETVGVVGQHFGLGAIVDLPHPLE
ncbi:hypothetical protein D3C86_1522770 [compost metagenome]